MTGVLLGSGRHTGREGVLRARQALVVGEVAAALVLLVVGSLMLQSAARLSAVDPGFRTDGVLTFGVVLRDEHYTEAGDRVRFATRVVEGLAALPGVRHAAVGAYAPMGDMLVTVQAITPRKLTRDQRKLLEQLAESLPAQKFDPTPRSADDRGLFEKVKDIFG